MCRQSGTNVLLPGFVHHKYYFDMKNGFLLLILGVFAFLRAKMTKKKVFRNFQEAQTPI